MKDTLDVVELIKIPIEIREKGYEKMAHHCFKIIRQKMIELLNKLA